MVETVWPEKEKTIFFSFNLTRSQILQLACSFTKTHTLKPKANTDMRISSMQHVSAMIENPFLQACEFKCVLLFSTACKMVSATISVRA